MRNRTILQGQDRIDFQVLTCQQGYARKTQHIRLTSEKDVNALRFYSSLYYVISLVEFTYLFSTDRGMYIYIYIYIYIFVHGNVPVIRFG